MSEHDSVSLDAKLARRVIELEDAIKQAIDYAGNYVCEWGERAEDCFQILEDVMMGKEKERAVWLRREGDFCVVLINAGGQWVEIMREHCEANFSHVVEASGITSAIRDAADNQSWNDCYASGDVPGRNI